MKIARLPLALLVAIAVMAFPAADHAEDGGSATVDAHELQAKLTYCKACHGASGQGYHGYSPIPRLAGQQPEYIENQLKAFIERRRQNPIMFSVAHVLSPQMLAALAAHFNGLNPKPLGGSDRELIPEGKKIFEEGIAASGIPPCASCHGPEAKGDGQFPRLAGQLPDYILRKLTNWDKERGQDRENPDTSAIMQPIAHELTQPQIKAVAAYVSSLD
jgi:cytochrome c553